MALTPVGTDVRLFGTNNPTFVIECDGIYYVTQSLAVYDPSKASDPAQKHNISLLQQILNQSSECKCVCARVPQENNIASMQQTGPNN